MLRRKVRDRTFSTQSAQSCHQPDVRNGREAHIQANVWTGWKADLTGCCPSLARDRWLLPVRMQAGRVFEWSGVIFQSAHLATFNPEVARALLERASTSYQHVFVGWNGSGRLKHTEALKRRAVALALDASLSCPNYKRPCQESDETVATKSIDQ